VEETKKLIDKHVPYVVRIKTPENIVIHFHDKSGEKSVFIPQKLTQILLKADGLPTITGQCGGRLSDENPSCHTGVEDWFIHPLHELYVRNSRMEDAIPQFCSSALILSPNGKGKLSN
jgi:hypothetical protein